jgi:hypothetical protein
VAGGWAKDERLGGLLARFASNMEMSVHLRLLAALDHFPSPALGDYVLRLVREEWTPAVMSSALDVDRVEAATTAETAVRFMQAIEARLTDGSIYGKMRARAGAAIAVAGTRAPDAGAELLGRLAVRESDAKFAQSLRDAGDALTRRTTSKRELEKMFR